MQKYQSVVQYNTGVAVAGASVTVKNYPSGTLATIYSDNGVTTTTNPLTTDSVGRFSFYAADGHYSLEITGVSLAPYTVTDILLEDTSEPSNVWVNNIIMPADEHYLYSGAVGTYGWTDNVKELYATGPNAPSLVSSFGPFWHYEFSPTTMNEVFANFHIIHDFALGTPISPHFHITTNSNNTGVVRIGFEWSTARRGDDTGTIQFTPTQTCYAEITIPSNSATPTPTHFVAQAADGIPAVTDINIDSLVIMRIFRDAAHPNDTFPDTILGLTVDLHYQVARLFTPNRDPDFF